MFSVVIPTCDRAHLLSSALESVIEDQGFDDYEIVVSDNFSSDHTRETVESFDCSRLRYVRTDSRLPMADHWHFALGHARGDYVSFLCDDDVWTPQVLATVASTIETSRTRLLGMFRGRYFAPNCDWAGWANSLAITPFTGNVLELESRRTLRALFERQESMRMPKMFNSFCHRSLIDSASKRWGRLFLPWCPDYSFPAIVLNETERWTLIDRPLWLRYYGSESIGAGARDSREGNFKQFLEEHGEERLPRRTPLAIPISTNYAVDTLLRVREIHPERFEGIDVDWERYFVTCWKELRLQELSGTNVAESNQHFEQALVGRGKDFANRVQTSIDALVYDEANHIFIPRPMAWPLRRTMSRMALPTAGWRYLTGLGRRLGGTNPGLFIKGSEGAFASILECARRVPKLVGRTAAGTRVSV